MNRIILHPEQAKDTISRHIYGHFSEHLGRLIYGGIWVGEDSSIPNTRGIRNDVVEALIKIKVPNLRWPGGCFADEYHWMDGIGPRKNRPTMVNTNWGNVTEDNSFGTHEFMDLCEQLNCEPLVTGNIGSGTVNEMAAWVNYLTAEYGPMAELRKKNGRENSWHVNYWCIGNETWGCGGLMSAEYYSNEMPRYSFFLKGNLFKIASGGTDSDYDWTETLMKKWSGSSDWTKGYMSGYSLHYYTVTHDWNNKGSATQFNEEEWFLTLSKALHIDELIKKHSAIMDKYDPEKKIALVVDEWGTWHDVEPGTNPGFLYQQNTLRDAMVAALSLNIFNNQCSRVRMANIAQVVNVLQAVILNDKEKMILTPTYHVFDMYKVHQDALQIPVEISSEEYELNGQSIQSINASASRSSDGRINLSLVNINPSKDIAVTISGILQKDIKGQILTSGKMQDHNTFEEPNKVVIKEFRDFSTTGNVFKVNMPSKSIIVLEVK